MATTKTRASKSVASGSASSKKDEGKEVGQKGQAEAKFSSSQAKNVKQEEKDLNSFEDLLGLPCKVWWKSENEDFAGIVKDLRRRVSAKKEVEGGKNKLEDVKVSKAIFVEYDDGDKEWIQVISGDFTQKPVRISESCPLEKVLNNKTGKYMDSKNYNPKPLEERRKEIMQEIAERRRAKQQQTTAQQKRVIKSETLELKLENNMAKVKPKSLSKTNKVQASKSPKMKVEKGDLNFIKDVVKLQQQPKKTINVTEGKSDMSNKQIDNVKERLVDKNHETFKRLSEQSQGSLIGQDQGEAKPKKFYLPPGKRRKMDLKNSNPIVKEDSEKTVDLEKDAVGPKKVYLPPGKRRQMDLKNSNPIVKEDSEKTVDLEKDAVGINAGNTTPSVPTTCAKTLTSTENTLKTSKAMDIKIEKTAEEKEKQKFSDHFEKHLNREDWFKTPITERDKKSFQSYRKIFENSDEYWDERLKNYLKRPIDRA